MRSIWLIHLAHVFDFVAAITSTNKLALTPSLFRNFMIVFPVATPLMEMIWLFELYVTSRSEGFEMVVRAGSTLAPSST